MPGSRTLRQGLVVGLIAYAAVAVFYAAFDVLAARGTLYTVDLLGKAVFRGLRDPSILQYPIEPDLGAVFLYNGLHLLLALAIGLIVTRLVDQADRHPTQGPLVLLVIVAGFGVTVYAVGALTQPMRPLLPWWSIVAANAFAALLAGLYLLRKRPGLPARLLHFAG